MLTDLRKVRRLPWRFGLHATARPGQDERAIRCGRRVGWSVRKRQAQHIVRGQRLSLSHQRNHGRRDGRRPHHVVRIARYRQAVAAQRDTRARGTS